MHRIYWALAVLVVPTVIGFATLSARADAPTIAADDRVLGKADAPITIFEYFSSPARIAQSSSATAIPS